jgi:hypothetical protein
VARPKVDGSKHDEVAVSLIVAGRRPAWISCHDRAEAVRRMAGTKHSDGQIAHALGCPRRTVLRIRTRLSILPGTPLGSNQNTLTQDAPIRPWALG